MIQENLTKYRKRLGLNQTEFAKLIGKTQQSYSNWERGSAEPGIKWLIVMAKAFAVTVDELVGAQTWFKYPENEPPREGKYTVFVENGKTEFQIDVNYIGGAFQIDHKNNITYYRPIAENPIK